MSCSTTSKEVFLFFKYNQKQIYIFFENFIYFCGNFDFGSDPDRLLDCFVGQGKMSMRTSHSDSWIKKFQDQPPVTNVKTVKNTQSNKLECIMQ